MALFERKKNKKVVEEKVIPTNIDQMTDEELKQVLRDIKLSELPNEYFTNLRSLFAVLKYYSYYGRSAGQVIFDRIPEELKNDREFLLKATDFDTGYFEFFPEKFKKDREFILDVIKLNKDCGSFVFDYLKPYIPLDREFLLKAIKITPKILYIVPKELRVNKKFMLDAFKMGGVGCLDFADKILFYDPTFQKEMQEVSDKRVDKLFSAPDENE